MKTKVQNMKRESIESIKTEITEILNMKKVEF